MIKINPSCLADSGLLINSNLGISLFQTQIILVLILCSKMVKPNPDSPKQEGEIEGGMTTSDTSPRQRHNAHIISLVILLHEDPSLRARNESTNTHYVSRFIFRVNNTLSITKFALNKYLENP